MKNHWLIGLNMVMLLTFTFMGCAFQTSLWMQVLGSFPPPLLWMILLTYIVLHRHIWEGIVMVYIVTAITASFTSLSMGDFLLINMLCLIYIWLVKTRIYWSSPNYFMLMCGSTTLLHFILGFVLSQIVDDNSMSSPQIFDWVISTLLTMLISLPLYRFLKWFDKLTQRDETAESTSGMT